VLIMDSPRTSFMSLSAQVCRVEEKGIMWFGLDHLCVWGVWTYYYDIYFPHDCPLIMCTHIQVTTARASQIWSSPLWTPWMHAHPHASRPCTPISITTLRESFVNAIETFVLTWRGQMKPRGTQRSCLLHR